MQSEVLKSDRDIRSNDFVYGQHVVLEGKLFVFATWDEFKGLWNVKVTLDLFDKVQSVVSEMELTFSWSDK